MKNRTSDLSGCSAVPRFFFFAVYQISNRTHLLGNVQCISASFILIHRLPVCSRHICLFFAPSLLNSFSHLTSGRPSFRLPHADHVRWQCICATLYLNPNISACNLYTAECFMNSRLKKGHYLFSFYILSLKFELLILLRMWDKYRNGHPCRCHFLYMRYTL